MFPFVSRSNRNYGAKFESIILTSKSRIRLFRADLNEILETNLQQWFFIPLFYIFIYSSRRIFLKLINSINIVIDIGKKSYTRFFSFSFQIESSGNTMSEDSTTSS